jgi:hypothetical protein
VRRESLGADERQARLLRDGGNKGVGRGGLLNLGGDGQGKGGGDGCEKPNERSFHRVYFLSEKWLLERF